MFFDSSFLLLLPGLQRDPSSSFACFASQASDSKTDCFHTLRRHPAAAAADTTVIQAVVDIGRPRSASRTAGRWDPAIASTIAAKHSSSLVGNLCFGLDQLSAINLLAGYLSSQLLRWARVSPDFLP